MNASPRTIAHITRRKALLTSATVGAAAVLPAAAATGASAATSKAARMTRTGQSPSPAGASTTFVAKGAQSAALPDARTRQILSSFTSGVSADKLAAVAAEGGIEAWFEHQLTPDDIPDPKIG